MLRVCFRKNGERYDTESMAHRHRSSYALWLHTPVGLVAGANQRSSEAESYRVLYASKHWKTLRRQALTRDAYQCQHSGCGAHLQSVRDHPRSAVVHHLKPHKGDLGLFFDLDNLQSVCWSCHSGDIQSTEALGYDRTIGNDGWPIDPKHPSLI